ncbi:MAG: DegT/DnrJ/EryC1/StrS family aminotransferase [bacterium]
MTLGEDDLHLALRLLRQRGSWEDDGPVTQYEAQFAEWNGSAHAFAFMGGRVALSACIHALDLKPGDEVIVPGYTCIVVANAFRFANVRPVFADIELQTYGPDIDSVRSRLTSRTRAILIHHLYGLVCRDYVKLVELARGRGLWLIEDCAHATGALFDGVPVGNLGDIAFYSSERSKVFSTVIGGLVTTNDVHLARKVARYKEEAPRPPGRLIEKILRNVQLDYFRRKGSEMPWRSRWARLAHGAERLQSTSREELRSEKPSHYGMKMPGPMALLGMNQLAKVSRFNETRRHTARRWDAWCDYRGYARPVVIPDSTPVFLRYPVLVEPERKANPGWLRKELGVEPGVWFRTHLHPAPGTVEGCPRADKAVAGCVNLPCLL